MCILIAFSLDEMGLKLIKTHRVHWLLVAPQAKHKKARAMTLAFK
jgi:hypothetical protein